MLSLCSYYPFVDTYSGNNKTFCGFLNPTITKEDTFLNAQNISSSSCAGRNSALMCAANHICLGFEKSVRSFFLDSYMSITLYYHLGTKILFILILNINKVIIVWGMSRTANLDLNIICNSAKWNNISTRDESLKVTHHEDLKIAISNAINTNCRIFFFDICGTIPKYYEDVFNSFKSLDNTKQCIWGGTFLLARHLPYIKEMTAHDNKKLDSVLDNIGELGKKNIFSYKFSYKVKN